MNFPFTLEQFINVFSQYNTRVWPAQAAIYLLAGIAVIAAIKKTKYSDMLVSMILGVFWLWMGVVYHWMFFSTVNPAAKLFGLLFVVQGLLFLIAGVVKNKILFRFEGNAREIMGMILVVFGPIIYPLLGMALGHTYPNSPTFGLPCPTTIFTFGLLLMTKKLPKYMVIIPTLWSVIGFMAAFAFGIKEDVFLLIAGLTSCGVIIVGNKNQEGSPLAKA